jgi:hypothetical protein
MEDQVIVSENHDRKYFILTPRIVWGLCETPLECTLWNVRKDIAGESGECFLSTDDLAILAMMSTGAVSKYRKILIDKKLIIGDFRKDPGYPQPVWHLSVPDLWEQNIKFSKENILIKKRIEYKKSLHLMKPSPGEGGVILGETKNKDKKNKKEEYLSAPADDPPDEISDPLAGYFGGSSSNGHKPKSETKSPQPPAKPKTEYVLAMDRLEAAFSRTRRCALPDWKNDPKVASKRWRMPLKRMWLKADKDIETTERGVMACAQKLLDINFTFDAPDQIEKTFGSWIIDHKNQIDLVSQSEAGVYV